MVLMDNYNATEGGIFAVTDRIGEPGMLMVPDRGVFFEFVPAAEHGKPDARRLPLWEVEPGVDYSDRGQHLARASSATSSATWCNSRASSRTGWSSWAGRRACSRSPRSSPRSWRSSAPWRPRCERPRARWWSSPPGRRSASAEPGRAGTRSSSSSSQPPADPHRFARAFDESLCAQNRVYREHRTADVAILPARPVHPASRRRPAVHGGHWPQEPAAEVPAGRREF